MGIFDKFMRALGFASDKELEEMEHKEKTKKNKPKKSTAIHNEYVLNENTNPNIVEFSPSSQKEVVQIVELMKQGASVRISFKNLEDDALHRAVDFLQGACQVLEIEPKFLKNEKVELIQ